MAQNTSSDHNPPLSKDQQDLNDILSTLKHAPDLLGCVDIGTDGVLRSLAASREVVDAIGLPTRLIKALLDRGPFRQELEDKLHGVDGTNVSGDEMLHPEKNLLPPPLSREEREEGEIFVGENRERMEEMKEKRRREERKSCAGVRSDYDLGVKEGGGDGG